MSVFVHKQWEESGACGLGKIIFKKNKKIFKSVSDFACLISFSYSKEAMKDTQNWIEGRMMYVGSLKR